MKTTACRRSAQPSVGKTFMPEMDEGDIIVGIEKLPSVSLEETAALDLMIHQALMKNIPEITGVVARAGSDEIGDRKSVV